MINVDSYFTVNVMGRDVIYRDVVDIVELWWSMVERGGMTLTMRTMEARGEPL